MVRTHFEGFWMSGERIHQWVFNMMFGEMGYQGPDNVFSSETVLLLLVSLLVYKLYVSQQ